MDYREKDRISQCRQNMMAMSTEEPHDFPLLSANCGKYRTMALMLRMASNNRHLLQFVQKLSAAEEDEGLPYWRKYMDELLRMPTAAEQDNLQQIQFYEQIVKYCGDEKRVKIAKAETSPGKTKDEKKRDLVTCMVDWIYDQSRREISPGMRRSMFLHLKSLQEKAFTSWFETYRAMEDDCCPIQIQDYCTEADFSDEDGEIRKIKDYFEEKKKLKYQSLKNTPLYVLCTAGMLCAGGAFFLHPFLLSGSAVCAVAAGVSRMRFRFQKQEIDCSIRKQEDSALRILGGLFTEYHQIKKQYREYDALSGQIMDIMKGE
ncbi:MAG: hypothetical protein LUC98_01695 [Lachnospiraceae bacterium]|nr:hypothetical protein [Lachnospiraceae bacterium]